MIKKVLLEFFLCTCVSVVSVLAFILIGLFYNAKEQTILINILVWTGVILLSYLTVVFFPIWKKKKVYYIDFLAFASGYFGVLIVCLARAKTLEEYSFVTILPFVSSFLGTLELILETQRIVEEKALAAKSNNVLELLKDETIETKKNILLIVNQFKREKSFTLEQVIVLCKKRKKGAEKLMTICEKHNIAIKQNIKGKIFFTIGNSELN